MKTNYYFFLFLIFCVASANAQLSITGSLIDDRTSEVLIGGNIISGTNTTVSDSEGKFTITVEEGKDLIISYLGYTDKVIAYSELSVDLVVRMIEVGNVLETATVTGSRYEKRLAESTISVEVIRPELIANTNTIEIDDVLDKVPGVQMIDGQANIRGGSGYSYGAGSRVMLLLDDMPALQADAGFPNWGDMPVENIGQVEVIKGAASASYGSSALNGIINIRRAEPTSTPLTKISTGYTLYLDPQDPIKKWWDSSPYSFNASIMHSQKKDKLSFSVGGFYRKLESFNQETFQDRFRIFIDTKYQLTDRLFLGLNTLYNRSESSDFFVWSNPVDGAFQPLPGNVSEKLNTRIMIDPYLVYYGDNGDKHRLQLRYFDTNNDNALNQSNKSQQVFGEYQYQHEFTEWKTKLTTGLLGTSTDTQAELLGDTTFNNTNAAIYIQLDKEMTDNWDITVGTRYEYNRQKSPEVFMGQTIDGGTVSDGEAIFRIGTNYQFNDYSSVRASWGQGYRFPTITERFITTSFSGFNIFPNPQLGPEQGWSSEIGMKQGVRILGFEGFIDVAGFWSEYTDMMEFTFANVDGIIGFQSQNIGNTKIRGFEFSTYGRIFVSNIPVNIYGGYTYMDPKYTEFTEQLQLASSVDENILKYRSKHNYKLDVEAVSDRWSIGGAVQHTSHMVAIDAALALLPGANISSYRNANNTGYFRLDGRVSYSLSDLKISLLMNNVLNAEYTVRPALLEAPRNVSVRLDYRI